MSEPKRGRAHDAEGAREAILNAAEEVFAEHGFDGARIAVIAAVAKYNSSLIFQYFGDKLGLYTAVLKRSDEELNALQARILAPLLEDETIPFDARRFKLLLETTVRTLFDYLVEHPRLMRMLMWEQAEGWQIYAEILSQFNMEENEPFDKLLRKAHSAGLLRSDFIPLIQLTLILQICLSYLSFVPLYQMLPPISEDLSSATELARAREYLVNFIVAGMLTSPDEAQS